MYEKQNASQGIAMWNGVQACWDALKKKTGFTQYDGENKEFAYNDGTFLICAVTLYLTEPRKRYHVSCPVCIETGEVVKEPVIFPLTN